MDYSSRKIARAYVWSVGRIRIEGGGEEGFEGTVDIALYDETESEIAPKIKVDVVVPGSWEMSVVAAEKLIVEAAIQVVKRVAQEPPEAIFDLWEKWTAPDSAV